MGETLHITGISKTVIGTAYLKIDFLSKLQIVADGWTKIYPTGG
jgi:hypothetical protein